MIVIIAVELFSIFVGLTRPRDKKGISSHIYIPWNKLVTEPSEFDLYNKRVSCYFDLCVCQLKSGRSVAGFIFARVSRKFYKILTNIIIVLSAFLSGLMFGFITFFHIWLLTPSRKVWQIPHLIYNLISYLLTFKDNFPARRYVEEVCGVILWRDHRLPHIRPQNSLCWGENQHWYPQHQSQWSIPSEGQIIDFMRW